jgi:hypothetical protein
MVHQGRAVTTLAMCTVHLYMNNSNSANSNAGRLNRQQTQCREVAVGQMNRQQQAAGTAGQQQQQQ